MKRMLLFLLVCMSTLSAVAKTGTPYVVEANSLNVRKSPSTDAAILGKVTKGQEVQVIKIEGGWACITFNRGNGFVSAQYIKKKGTASSTSSKSTSAASSSSAKSSSTSTRKFPYTEGDRARYGGWTETGLIFNAAGAGFNLDLVNGCYIRDYIFVGAGVGLRGYFSPAPGMFIGVPIYAQARGVLRVNRIVAPFVDLGIGGYAGYATDWEESTSGGGFYLRIAPGIRIGKHFHVSMGYERCGFNTGVMTIGADW